MDYLHHINWAELASQGLPLFLLTGVATLVLFLELFRAPHAAEAATWRSPAALVAMLGTLLVMWLIVPRWIDATNPASLALWWFDRIAWVGALIILTATLCAMLLSTHYLRARHLPHGEYLALTLFGAVGLWCMIATHHLIMIFIGLEILSLAAYVMAAYARAEKSSLEAGIKYFLMGAVASAFLFFGLALLYGGTGTLDLVHYQSLAASALEPIDQLYTKIGLACVLIGFCFKIAAVPFHWWAPDVYTGAPLPVTAYFATAVKAGAFLALWRLTDAIVGITGVEWQGLLWWLAVATMTLGNLAALTQTDMKRMLAYSSIAHAGYALIALVIVRHGGDAAITSLLFYLVAYTCMTVGAFAVLIAIGTATEERTLLDDVAGFSRRRPGLAAAFAIFLLSLAGIPPTIGFFGKYFLFQAAIGAGETWLVIIAVLNSVVSVAYYVRPIVTMYFRSDSVHSDALGRIPNGVRVVIAVALLAVMLCGLFPSGLLRLLTQSAG